MGHFHKPLPASANSGPPENEAGWKHYKKLAFTAYGKRNSLHMRDILNDKYNIYPDWKDGWYHWYNRVLNPDMTLGHGVKYFVTMYYDSMKDTSYHMINKEYANYEDIPVNLKAIMKPNGNNNQQIIEEEEPPDIEEEEEEPEPVSGQYTLPSQPAPIKQPTVATTSHMTEQPEDFGNTINPLLPDPNWEQQFTEQNNEISKKRQDFIMQKLVQLEKSRVELDVVTAKTLTEINIHLVDHVNGIRNIVSQISDVIRGLKPNQ